MKVAIQHTIDLNRLQETLKEKFPDYSVKFAKFNKSTLRVTQGMSQVVIGQMKNQKLICVGNINMLNPKFLIPYCILMALGILPGILFLITMMQLHKKKYKAMEQELASFLQNYIGF